MPFARLTAADRIEWAPRLLEIDGYTVANPTPAQLRAAGYKPVIYPDGEAPAGAAPRYTEEADGIRVKWTAAEVLAAPSYEQRVEALIRERCTVSDELAILRQRDTKPEEFDRYFAYCEQCKAKSRE